MSDPVAEFLAREDGALDDDIDVGIQEPPAPVQPVNDDLLPVHQNGIHREGGDSGVDLAAQDSPDFVPSGPLSNGNASRQSNSTPVREEHETIKRWREEHAKLLKEKDDAELKQKEAMREAASIELKKWKEQHVKEITERKKQNREAEQKLQKESKAPSKGDSWQEVATIVDSVAIKSASKNSPDTSRMKSLILDRKAVA